MPEKKTKAVISSLTININHTEEDEIEKNGNSFTAKYKILGKIGEGSYSEVLKCRNRETGILLAAKKLKHRYRDWKRVNDMAEVATLRRLPKHLNILQMMEIHYDPAAGRVFLIFELMEMNLYELIKERKRIVGSSLLSETRVQVFMFQLIRAIGHLHKNGIFHRDVKPENILLETKTDILKLGDLGSINNLTNKPPFTEYISTRWYRPPECLLTSGFYNYKMDIWAAGCVFYEIMTLRPLFPGASEIDQVSRIHQIVGPPSPKMLKKFSDHSEMSRKIIHRSSKAERRDSITKVLVQLQTSDVKSRKVHASASTNNGRKYLINFQKRLPSHVSREGIDLLGNMLEYDPENRPPSHTALLHPYFDELRKTAKMMIAKQKYDHPLMAILGPEFIKEIKEQEQKNNLVEKYQDDISTDTEESDYEKSVARKPNRAQKRAKEYSQRRLSSSSSSSDCTLSNDSSSETKIPKAREKKSPRKVKKRKPLEESKTLNINVNIKAEDTSKKDPKLKSGPPKKAKYDDGTKKKVIDAPVLKNRPPLPLQGNNLASKRSSQTKFEFSLMEEFLKPLKSDSESLSMKMTTADLQKINEGRRLVQMLPIGGKAKADIKKHVLSEDNSKTPASMSSTREIPRHFLRRGMNFDSDQKLKGSNHFGARNQFELRTNDKKALSFEGTSNSTSVNVPSLAERLKTLYPISKPAESLMKVKLDNQNQRQPMSRQELLESKARALAIMGCKYKFPSKAPISDVKFEEQMKNKSEGKADLGGVPPDLNLKKMPVPAQPEMLQSIAERLARHRYYLRQKARETVNFDKYKNEVSPYSKFFVDHDVPEEKKSGRENKINDLRSGDLNGSRIAVRRITTDGELRIAAAAQLPLNTGALERQRLLYLQRQGQNFKNEMVPNSKFLITTATPHDLKEEGTGANLKSNSTSKNNNSGYGPSPWYLPLNASNIASEKYKKENSPYTKYYSGGNVTEIRSKVKDTTGAGSIVFPRNRFGDNSSRKANGHSQNQDYNFSSKISMDFRPSYRNPLNVFPKAKF